MSDKLHFSKKRAKEVGEILRIDWRKIDFEQFYMGINVELEHGSRFGCTTNVSSDSAVISGRIALAHLFEIPDYYTRLDAMEEKAKKEMRKNKKRHK
ncbi:hypothetical protein Ccar_09950 [Clostridium carboxidivorans P7]|uniref:Uncharacterized protein n=1 Tax=Clostridium carboxidivorans P7 TaxID=536227 RepID=C6PX27_9CLOT|nr:DUF5661 family protein [Clostridium carboxidivorans]AKN31153.1 hypothetical protein Ccar_09950 [Clostridium carboxidivorans P7]EET86204.1 conserved hypothetical protein [Clostridium carboxidivorans P7]EFG88261.1 hypothetical protein CLCAR_1835 [Clostridium carboxidivorans P7]